MKTPGDSLPPSSPGGKSASLMLIDVLLRWRRFIAYCVLGGTLIAFAVAFLIPPKFKATASVFPAEKTDILPGLEGASSLMKSFSTAKSLAGLATNPELDRYMAILKSGRVLSAVVQKFDLVHVYDITTYPGENTIKELLSNVDFSLEQEGYLIITVYDRDPQRAADMANFFVEELNRTNGEMLVLNARGNRQFIEERYLKNLKDLAAAEDSLKSFQKRFGVITMPEQTTASIKAGAELAAQLALKQVDLAVKLRTLSADHPSVLSLRIEIDELQKKMSQMNSGIGQKASDMNVFVPFKDIPDLGSEYVRRFRDVEIQYKILQIVTPIYEQAKVEEQRETPSVIVLDRGAPAERKAKPKRLLIILAGFGISLLGSLLYGVASDRWSAERERNSAFYQSATSFMLGVRADLRELAGRIRRTSVRK
jgi:tyrosine-protein kinase Etk/Wzc